MHVLSVKKYKSKAVVVVMEDEDQTKLLFTTKQQGVNSEELEGWLHQEKPYMPKHL